MTDNEGSGRPGANRDPSQGASRDPTRDPTALRAQPSLTTSSGTVWLIVGGIFAAVSLAVLIPMTALPPGGLALAAVIAVVALYLGMVLVRLVVGPGRRRLGLLATGMLLIAGISLVTSAIVMIVTWNAAAS